MMDESKLTNFQRRTLSAQAKGGKALPATCSPTSSKQKDHTIARETPPKVMNGRELVMSGKRKKNTIDLITEHNDTGVYRPLPAKVISEKDKRKLQHKMAYGVDLPEISKVKANIPQIEVEDENIDEFENVLQDIEERRQFLKEMEMLGQGKKYKTQIQTEISQKIRELELIDKKKTVEMETKLHNNNNKSSAEKT